MKTKAYFLILVLAVFFGRAAAQDYAAENLKLDFNSWSSAAAEREPPPRPPLNAGRVAGEILSGTVCGTVCGIALATAGWALTYNYNPEFGDFSRLTGLSWAYIGASIGFIIGTPLGVWIVGSIGNETGSFFAALGGSFLGALTVVLATQIFKSEDFSLIYLALPIVGSTIAFNMTRRYKSGHSAASLINYDQGWLCFSFPRIYVRPSLSRPGAMCLSLDLASVGL
jgi:hypothetical protein